MVSSIDMEEMGRIRKCAKERENVVIGAACACRENDEPLNTVDAIKQAFREMDAKIEEAARNGKKIVPLIPLLFELEADDSKEEREQLGFVAYEHFWDRLVDEGLNPTIHFVCYSVVDEKMPEGAMCNGFFISVILP